MVDLVAQDLKEEGRVGLVGRLVGRWLVCVGRWSVGSYGPVQDHVVPVVGLVSALLVGERVGAAQLVGGALAVLGVLVEDAVAPKGRGRRRPGSGAG